jgi:hypothetical protein
MSGIHYTGVDSLGGGRELLASPNILSIRPNKSGRLDFGECIIDQALAEIR